MQNSNQFFITVNYGESQANSSSRLETQGLIMTWLSKCCQFKGLQKNFRLKMKKFRVIRKDFGSKSGSRVVFLSNRLKLSKCPVQKGINFSQVRVERPSENFRLQMKIPVYNPVQGKDVSHKSLKLPISGSKSRFKKDLSLAKS